MADGRRCEKPFSPSDSLSGVGAVAGHRVRQRAFCKSAGLCCVGVCSVRHRCPFRAYFKGAIQSHAELCRMLWCNHGFLYQF